MIYRSYMFMKWLVAATYFWFPSKKLECYGVTWTDGKSTTNEILYHVMKEAWIKVWIISTVSIDVWMGKESNHTKLTSVSHWTFQKLLRQAADNWLTHMVVEPSSHALYQWRVWPIKFKWVWFTNLTREHLDFHWTMDHYFATKLRLFREYASRDARGIIPAWFDYRDEAERRSRVGELLTFGYDNNADIRVDAITESPQLSFDMHLWDQVARVDTTMLWTFNADNMMIAAMLAMKAWVLWDACIEWLWSFPWLPGRQELVIGSTGVTAMIDFALTPDGLTTLYKAVRTMWYGKQIAVFGATWNRDKGKRPVMGRVAAEHCDLVVITEDENYHENGLDIMHAVYEGVAVGDREKIELVQDRTLAIRRGLELAQPGDVVIITGMANFTSRAMNEWTIPWNEREVIEECMKELGLL